MKKTIFKNLSLLSAAVVLVTAAFIVIAESIAGEMTKPMAAAVVISVIALTALAVFAMRIISEKVTSMIVRRVDAIDLDNPQIEYMELLPFMRRARSKKQIKIKAEQMRREFSANVSHELKTPLTSISGYAQMINNGMAKEEDILKFTKLIEKESLRLISLVNDIIEISHLDEQNKLPEAEKIDLSEIAAETIASLEKSAAEKNVQIFYSGSETHINGNKTLIGELMTNVIDNAIKYNKDDGTVTVFVGIVNGGAVFSVKDTGIGIPEEDIDRIFERFYRVDKSHSKTVGGTGLGLSIVKHIAMCHDAEIRVKSEVGTGSTVSVIFKSI